MLINPLSGNPYSPRRDRPGQLGQYRDRVEGRVIRQRVTLVAKKLGRGADLGALEKGVSVSVPSNTQIIEVSFASGDAAFARAAAQAYVVSFLDYRTQRAQAVNACPGSLPEEPASCRTAPADHGAEPGSAGVNTAYYDALIKTLNAQVVSLQTQINALDAEKSDAGRVISPASIPLKLSGIGRSLYLVAGGMLGLVLGLALALARQRRDDRVLHVDEIDAAGIPVLATVGRTREGSAEAVRLIRARALSSTRRPTIVVVGPTRPRRGQSQIAAQLADSVANVGRSVVFVDLAEESSTVHGEARYGLTDLLTGDRVILRDLLVEAEPNLTVLPKGRTDLGEAIEFLDAARLRKLISELPRRADYVVLNTPSLIDSVGETLMEIAHLAVVTVTLAQATRSELAVIKSRGDDRVGACVVPKARRRRRMSSWRFRREGSTQVSRAGDALTLVNDEEKSA